MEDLKETYSYQHKPWKKVLSVILSLIIAFGTFVSMTVGNFMLSDYVDMQTAFAAETESAALSPVPVFYRYGELVGLYRVLYTDKTKIQYKIGDNGEWTDYTVPFSIPAFKTTKVYARIGETGKITYMNLSNTKKAIGVYTEENTDFGFSYNNIDFGYTRIYNSADKDWFESIHSKVMATESRLEVTLPDSSQCHFIRENTNTYKDQLTGKTLTKTASEYVYDDGEYIYHFAIKGIDSVSYLSAIEDHNGNRLNLNRTANTNEIAISDGAGRSFAVSDYRAINAPDGSDVKYYSQKDITDPNGNKITYTTKQDKYIEIKDQAGVYLGKYTYTNNTTDFTLTKSNDKAIEYYPNGRLKKVTYDNGSWIQYTYTDAEKTYTTLTSSGEGTKTVYNDAFMPTEYTDEYGTTTTYTYDDHYRVLTEKTGDDTTTYTYDTKGNILSWVTSNEEDNTYFTYNSAGKVVREQNGNDYSYYTYDNKGNNLIYATLKEDYEGEAPALYDSSLTCFDTTEYTYDSKGRVVKEKDSLGSIYEYEYDAAGNVTKETFTEDDKTTVTTYTYDSFGNVLTTGCEKDTSSYIYDKAGRTLLATENGESTRTLYDDLGRTVQEIGPSDYDSTKDGLPTSNTYADKNVGHRYFYNDKNQLVKETNHLDVVTDYEYFDTGEKKKESFDIYEYNYNVKGSLTDVFISGVNTVSYDYDDNNNLTLEAYANGDSIRYEYDENDNLVKQYHNEDTSPYVTYSYNADDELTQKVNADTGLKYVYGENNKVEVYKLSDNTLVQSYIEEEIKDENANPNTDFELGDNGESYINKEGNPNDGTKISETHFGNSYSLFASDRSLKYTFNENTVEFNYKNKIMPDGKVEERVAGDSVKYNDMVKLSAMYTYDDNGNIVQTEYKTGQGVFNIFNGYDDDGKLTQTGYDAMDFNYLYDDNDQLVRTDNDFFDYTSAYIYDDRGNITARNVYEFTKESLDKKRLLLRLHLLTLKMVGKIN